MTVLRLAFGNWFSRGYLLAVLAVAVFVTVSLLTHEGPDANLAGVWLLVVTMPGSLIVSGFVDDAPLAVVVAVLAFGALLNAVLIGAVVHLIRRARAGGPSTGR